METLLIILLALVLDLTLGEPPPVLHPVVWMGKLASFLLKGSRSHSSVIQFLYGMGIVVVTLGGFVVPVFFGLAYLKNLSPVAYVVTGAVLLKTSFALKELRRSALKIKHLLVKDNLDEARFELRSLVGRDNSQLDKVLMVSATVESVAENTCDSFVAPLFYFLFFGVPGAIAYRVINTLDAMIGHRGEFEYLGKFAALLDSAANYVPARITALLVVLAAWIQKKDASMAWRIMVRDRKKTESPNAGWTMSAIAGALGVRLEKVGYYRLGDNHYPLITSTIDASLQIIMTSAFIWGILIIMAEVIYHVTT